MGRSSGNTGMLPLAGPNCLKDHRTVTFKMQNFSTYAVTLSDNYGGLLCSQKVRFRKVLEVDELKTKTKLSQINSHQNYRKKQ